MLGYSNCHIMLRDTANVHDLECVRVIVFTVLALKPGNCSLVSQSGVTFRAAHRNASRLSTVTSYAADWTTLQLESGCSASCVGRVQVLLLELLLDDGRASETAVHAAISSRPPISTAKKQYPCSITTDIRCGSGAVTEFGACLRF